MKLTVKEIKKRIAEADQKKAALEQSIRELEEKAQTLTEEIQTAAENDNEAAFFSKKEALSLTEDRISMKKAQLEHLAAPYTPEEVRGVWTDYAAEYHKNLAAHQKEMDKTRAILHKQFSEMVDLQNNALIFREECADLMKLGNPEDLPMHTIGNQSHRKNYGGMQNPDATYLMECGLEPESNLFAVPFSSTKAYTVIVTKKPYRE